MHWTKFDLQQMDDDWVEGLPDDLLRQTLKKMLAEYKEARDRLNMTPENSSVPPSSKKPWDSTPPPPDHPNDTRQRPESETEKVDTVPDDAQAGAGASGDAAKPMNTSPAPGKAQGKQTGAPGFGRTQQFPVNETCTHYPDVCAACGKPLSQDGAMPKWMAWMQVDIVPLMAGEAGLKLHNTRHELHQGRCGCCGHVTRAMPYRAPDDAQWDKTGLAEWRLAGPQLAAMIVILALRMRLSRRLIREFFDLFIGLSLSTGMIDRTIREAGRAVLPLEDELVADIVQAPLLNIDETSWKEAGRLLWLWTLVSATTVYFAIGYRTGELLANILEDKFTGILMSDGYAVYRQWEDRLRCWAHLTRKMRGLAESSDGRVADIGRRMEAIFDILMAAIYAARIDPPSEPLTILHADSIIALSQICERHSDDLHIKLRSLAREMLYDWTVILRQLGEPHLPLTNNLAERTLRHWVISRLISHGTRSADGTRAFALLASVIETCRLRQASPWRYLATVIAASRKGLVPPSLPIIPALAAGV